ncbi:sugar phosphate permease [Antricoccus suffuscus]|uniref:Sugar phosphate permease n=1 Tax=Antricoccus suffuscus TaxID=1629062 RepID=A0A2T1A6M0_9ACTN|nr:MFS transporter [Antricoccus suffuscus]PRZ44253.1 sugar phosphate permease [Antricoccus suffuscus]
MARQATDGELRRALVALAVTEIVSWGVLYYSLPVASAAISSDTGWSRTTIAAIYSSSILLSAFMGIWIGRLLDRIGPRIVMSTGSVIGAAGLVLCSQAPHLAVFIVAWLVIGVAQSATLYPPAFTALTRWYGVRRAWPLTILTLVAGFASTVFAPLIALLLDHLDWRQAYLVLAAIGLIITLPLHLVALRAPWPSTPRGATGKTALAVELRAITHTKRFRALQAATMVAGLGLYSVTLNLIPLLTARGFSDSLAALTFGLVGAGQVAGRLVFAPLSGKGTPRARISTQMILTVVALTLVATIPGPVGIVIAAAIFIGAVRGSHTLLMPTSVADRWGTANFGALSGLFNAPIAAAIAISPLAGALLADGLGGYAAAAGVFAVLAVVGVVLSRRT